MDVSSLRIGLVCGACVVLTAPFLLAQTKEPSKPDPVADFRHRYKAAPDDKTRRDVVIKAIDDGLIRVFGDSSRLADIRRLFEADLYREGVEDRDRGIVRYIVLFRPVVPTSNPMISPAVEGWYIRLYFFDDGTLVYYKLSNVHKSVFDG